MSIFDIMGLGNTSHSGYRDRQPAGEQLRESLAEARANKAVNSSTSIDLLEDRIDRLTLVSMAMWSLLQDKTKLTEEDLLERVKTLDLMDGVADSKATRTMQRCQKCNRPMSMRHQRCLYCGHEKLVQSAFDKL